MNTAVAAVSDRSPRRPGAEPLSRDLQRRAQALVEAQGLFPAAKMLGCSAMSLARAITGGPVRVGTAALIEKNLPAPSAPSDGV